jgi:hypothetical protein
MPILKKVAEAPTSNGLTCPDYLQFRQLTVGHRSALPSNLFIGYDEKLRLNDTSLKSE